MYNFNLINDEEIILIVDDVSTYKDNKLFTFIVTNKRLLVLDYPSGLYNSMEDLRISSKINYVRMKEIIFEKELKNIKNVSKIRKKNRITFIDNSFIEFDSDDIYNALKIKE